MKQSAIEWLFQKLWDTPKDKFTWQSILEQAKDLEKEQIEDAYWEGGQDVPVNVKQCESYYNETFKSE